MRRYLVGSFLVLLLCYAVAYPLAVIGVAFNVQPPFSLGGAGSALLFLEGGIVLVAASLLYRWRRVLLITVGVLVLAYLVEALGVTTGFPFGRYYYTMTLIPRLPGGVPLPVLFAWILIVFGSYALVKHCPLARRGMHVGAALSGALLATLLDLAIEPVAAHVVSYWIWQAQGPSQYYGVPLANFVAWFVVVLVMFVLMALVLGEWRGRARMMRAERAGLCSGDGSEKSAMCVDDDREEKVVVPTRFGMMTRLAIAAPCILFVASLLMFGLVDLTHGYYLAVLAVLLAGGLLLVLQRLSG